VILIHNLLSVWEELSHLGGNIPGKVLQSGGKKKRKITNEQKEKQIKEKALNAAVQCKYKGPH